MDDPMTGKSIICHDSILHSSALPLFTLLPAAAVTTASPATSQPYSYPTTAIPTSLLCFPIMLLPFFHFHSLSCYPVIIVSAIASPANLFLPCHTYS
ncbi:hypothetical protein E2C01_031371 [Portunus trituberculatus]|uniref:Uncharacterized protein n=1 Tax=Portunus trituberculatus TaxID=210409 RepID=A0A5B7EXF0_PORTR|nr:hypothetical protein [Portunus trituberculatus]